jgi:hypothetical protein
LGSYRQGDIFGGVVNTIGYGAFYGLLFYSGHIPYGRINRQFRTDHQNRVVDSIFYGFVATGLATGVFSFIRPYMFNNRQQAAPVMNRLSFEPVFCGQGKTALRLGYTLSF